jgi:hypothetical protein
MRHATVFDFARRASIGLTIPYTLVSFASISWCRAAEGIVGLPAFPSRRVTVA